MQFAPFACLQKIHNYTISDKTNAGIRVVHTIFAIFCKPEIISK